MHNVWSVGRETPAVIHHAQVWSHDLADKHYGCAVRALALAQTHGGFMEERQGSIILDIV